MYFRQITSADDIFCSHVFKNAVFVGCNYVQKKVFFANHWQFHKHLYNLFEFLFSGLDIKSYFDTDLKGIYVSS